MDAQDKNGAHANDLEGKQPDDASAIGAVGSDLSPDRPDHRRPSKLASQALQVPRLPKSSPRQPNPKLKRSPTQTTT